MTRHLKEAQHYGATAARIAAAEAKRAADAAQFLAQMNLLKTQLEASSRTPGNWYTTAGAIQNVPGSIITANTYAGLQNQLVQQQALQAQAGVSNAAAVDAMREAAAKNRATELLHAAKMQTAAQQAFGGREHTRKLHKGKKR